jgi:hypothetical protein
MPASPGYCRHRSAQRRKQSMDKHVRDEWHASKRNEHIHTYIHTQHHKTTPHHTTPHSTTTHHTAQQHNDTTHTQTQQWRNTFTHQIQGFPLTWWVNFWLKPLSPEIGF